MLGREPMRVVSSDPQSKPGHLIESFVASLGSSWQPVSIASNTVCFVGVIVISGLSMAAFVIYGAACLFDRNSSGIHMCVNM